MKSCIFCAVVYFFVFVGRNSCEGSVYPTYEWEGVPRRKASFWVDGKNIGYEDVSTLSLKGARMVNDAVGSSIEKIFQLISEDLKIIEANYTMSDDVTSNKSEAFSLSKQLSENPYMVEPAFCQTEYVTTPLNIKDKEDPLSLFYPTCIRIQKCGGCCSHSLLSCQPTETEVLNVTIMKANEAKKKVEYITLRVEQHKKCSCECIVKESDCNRNQIYVPQECRCACKNSKEEQQKCATVPFKIWNPHMCRCQCSTIYECSTGLFFDPLECTCKKWYNL